MDAIRFDKTKLWIHAGLSLLVVLCCWYVMADSSPSVGRGLKGFLTGETGRAFILPFVSLGFVFYGFRMLWLALGDAPAIEFPDEGLRIRTIWTGSKLIPWKQFKRAKIQKVRVGLFVSVKQLVIERNWKWSIRMPVALLRFDGSKAHLLIELIELMETRGFALGQEMSPQFRKAMERDEAPRRPAPARAPVPLAPKPKAEPQPEPAFDADAALANYLAKKKSGLLEAPGASPAVRGFGRKGL